MLVIKIELWPGGDGRKRRELARMQIGNLGAVDIRNPDVCRYSVGFTEEASDVTRIPKRVTGNFSLDYYRRQTVFRIVAECAERAAAMIAAKFAKQPMYTLDKTED